MAINDVIFQALASFSGTINDKMKAFYTAVGNGLFSGGGVPGVVAPGVLAQSAVAAPVTGTTTETVLATIPIPSGAMGVNGTLRITTLWTYTNSANNKIVRVKLGPTAFLSATHTTTAQFQTQTMIRNRGVANSQIGFAASALSAFTTTSSSPATGTVDTSVAQELTITAQLANSGETITLESYIVEILNP